MKQWCCWQEVVCHVTLCCPQSSGDGVIGETVSPETIDACQNHGLAVKGNAQYLNCYISWLH